MVVMGSTMFFCFFLNIAVFHTFREASCNNPDMSCLFAVMFTGRTNAGQSGKPTGYTVSLLL